MGDYGLRAIHVAPDEHSECEGRANVVGASILETESLTVCSSAKFNPFVPHHDAFN